MRDLSEFSDGPLSGVRVLDLARVIAGPYVSRVFADMGAEVVKVEPPDGDQVRQIAPKHDRGMSGLFTFANVGKRGICLDLRRPEGVAVVADLVRVSDVVIENFRPGVLDAMQLGWEQISALNPRAVLASLNGFGRDSVWRDRRAYAPIVHAVTGILDDQGRYAGQPVAQINHAHADTLTSLHAAVAVLAALRVAAETGRGQHVEVPMFDSVLSSYTEVANELLPQADDRVMNPIYDAGRHGAIATAGSEQHVWFNVRRANAGLEDPAPRDSDVPTKARLRRRALEAWMAAHPSPEALARGLADAGVASAPLVTLTSALRGPLAEERQLLTSVDDRRGASRPVVRPPARFSAGENRVRGVAPRRGEHNESVLVELLGYEPERVRSLEESGILLKSPKGER